jgi:hypothetical protein
LVPIVGFDELINDSQREQWIRAIEVFDDDAGAMEQLKLFAAERGLLAAASDRVELRLKDFELHRSRQRTSRN